VLKLVTAGMSDREIAVQLVVSDHTVRRHLQNIFAKAGVSSRAAATAYAFEHGLN
jgi:DNA-binding NarL/FixJ family response regulator